VPRKRLPPVRREAFLYSEGRSAIAHEVWAMIEQFDELAILDPGVAAALGSALAKAVRLAKMGWPVKRADVSGLEWTREMLAFDVAEAMRAAGLPVRSWRQDTIDRDARPGEALYYRMLRATADLAGIDIPADAFRLKQRADQIVRIKHPDIKLR
jgi:hypothetical protein